MKRENNYIKSFYNNFSSNLNSSGYNFRHYHISKWLDNLVEINDDDNALEIGCGPGYSTYNLTKKISKGKILGIDISEENIAIAKKIHEKTSNVEFHVSDMSDFITDIKFDIVILPDVLEHIPFDQHHDLFKTIRSCLKDSGSVIINIPDPDYLEFEHVTNKENLQVIDQPIHTYILSEKLKDTGLKITHLQCYSIDTVCFNYQILKLQPNDLKLSSKLVPWDMSLKSRLRRRINTIRGIKSFD